MQLDTTSTKKIKDVQDVHNVEPHKMANISIHIQSCNVHFGFTYDGLS